MSVGNTLRYNSVSMVVGTLSLVSSHLSAQLTAERIDPSNRASIEDQTPRDTEASGNKYVTGG